LLEIIRSKPFLVAVVAGLAAQTLKVVTFLILEKRVNYKRFVETDGTPNMHSAAFAALAVYVGSVEGFDSIIFALSLCMLAMTSVDTWNVKRAHFRHQELVEMILDRISRRPDDFPRSRKALSFTPVDVLAGTLLGTIVALLFV